MTSVETIASLAMLKVNADQQGTDYLDYLVPFVCEVVASQADRPVNVTDVKKALRAEFGLRLPAAPVELVLKRLARRKILENRAGIYVPGRKFRRNSFQERRAKARSSIERVIESLQVFCDTRFKKTLSRDDAVDAITVYLSRFSIQFLSAYARGTALPIVPKRTHEASFLVNSFIAGAYSEKSEVFEDIVVLVKGNMLANALICPDLEAIHGNFGGVRFFLDTPFVLRLLGLEGAPVFEAASELIELLRNLRASISIFNHTAYEVDQVLASCERRLEDPKARAPIIFEMRKAGKTRSDLMLIRSRMDRFYGSHAISKWAAPNYEAAFQIDEQVLQDAIADEIHYMNPRALDYDINSIRSIYAIRQGLAPARLQNAKAVLVTTNRKLARVAYKFGRQHESTREVSSVITDFSLGNVAWLKAPLGSDLPRHEIVATCFAALEPSAKLWARYVDEIAKLRAEGKVTVEDHEALRLELVAREELMNLTLGDEKAFSAKTIEQILDVVKREYTREYTQRIATEEAAHSTTRGTLSQFRARREKRRKELYWLGFRVGVYGRWAVIVLTLPLLCAGAFLTTYGTGAYVHNFLATTLTNLVLGITVIWTVISGFFDTSLSEFAQRFGSWLQQCSYRLMCRFADVEPQGELADGGEVGDDVTG
jgi:hypothetical protein